MFDTILNKLYEWLYYGQNLQYIVSDLFVRTYLLSGAYNKRERALRLTESCLELARAGGMSKADAKNLVEYIYEIKPFSSENNTTKEVLVGETCLELFAFSMNFNIGVERELRLAMLRMQRHPSLKLHKYQMKPQELRAIPR